MAYEWVNRPHAMINVRMTRDQWVKRHKTIKTTVGRLISMKAFLKI